MADSVGAAPPTDSLGAVADAVMLDSSRAPSLTNCLCEIGQCRRDFLGGFPATNCFGAVDGLLLADVPRAP